MGTYDPPATFLGRLQRGRGSAVRHAAAGSGAADSVYACVLDDPRWDRQVDDRDEYLAGMIRLLDLSVAPIERHLVAFDGEDAGDIDLALAVLALLPLAGRQDAASVLRRYALEGRHWVEALWAVDHAGTLRLPGLWDGLADDVVAVHGEIRIREAAQFGSEPWATWADSQPTIRRVLEDLDAENSRPRVMGLDPRELRREMANKATDELIRVIEAGGVERRRAIEELGRRGEPIVLEMAEDPSLRNVAEWIPGMPRALGRLGPAALSRARAWVSGDATMRRLGVGVLADHGDAGDVPVLSAALRRAVGKESWCEAETPARGLGRLHAADAVDALAEAWQSTAHSRAREAFLQGLLGCAGGDRAASFTAEALYDCEPSVQQLACRTAADGAALRSRLGELADDPLTPEVHEAARARLAVLPGH